MGIGVGIVTVFVQSQRLDLHQETDTMQYMFAAQRGRALLVLDYMAVVYCGLGGSKAVLVEAEQVRASKTPRSRPTITHACLLCLVGRRSLHDAKTVQRR